MKVSKMLSFFMVFTALGFTALQPSPGGGSEVLDQFITAANKHDLAAMQRLLADEVIWYFGEDTLSGKAAVMRQLEFDASVKTTYRAVDVVVRGDAIDFELIERSDLLQTLGISALHRFPRFILRDGLIFRRLARQPIREEKLFTERMMHFINWISQNRPEAMQKLWPQNQFIYGKDGAQLMLRLVREWNQAATLPGHGKK